MAKRPECAVDGCTRDAFILFAGKWVCGVCVSNYDRLLKEKQFNQLQEVSSNASNNLS